MTLRFDQFTLMSPKYFKSSPIPDKKNLLLGRDETSTIEREQCGSLRKKIITKYEDFQVYMKGQENLHPGE